MLCRDFSYFSSDLSIRQQDPNLQDFNPIKMWIFQRDELDSQVNLGESPAEQFRFRAIKAEASIAHGEHILMVSKWGMST